MSSDHNECRSCFPTGCDLFRKDVCKGKQVDGEFAVAKASLRVLEKLKKEQNGRLTR